MGSKKRLGQALLYGSCMGLAAVMLGYYWLGYIPSQREYFANLRFRTLAAIGDQLHAKIESLVSSLVYVGDYGDGRAGYLQEYLAALVPDLQYQGVQATPGQPRVELREREDTVRFYSAKGHVADASLRGMLSRLASDEMFDDMIIAEGTKGRVLYQRSRSSPRILSLDEILKPAANAKAVPEGNGRDADAVRKVLWDGMEFTLLIQPVPLAALGESQGSLTLCGLVRSQRLAQEAHHVPPAYLLVVFVPLLILVLGGPFLKILLLTRTARLAFRDAVLLGVCAVFAAAIVAVWMVYWQPHPFGEVDPDPELSAFANQLDDGIFSDVTEMHDALVKFDAALPGDEDAIQDRTSLLESSPLARSIFSRAPFDFVFWSNAKGCQAAKWTVRILNTQRVDQTSEVHFQNVLAGRLWSLPASPEHPFTLVPEMSPTTSQFIAVMAMPSAHSGLEVETCIDRRPPSPVVSAALEGPLRSLSSPLLPPDIGFAVFQPDGLVLFHSSPERNLHENLFEEIDSPQRLRAAVAMHARCSVSTYYRGRACRIDVQPVTRIAGIPWNIAVFRQGEPQQTVTGMIWGDTLILFTALMGLMVLGFCLASVVLRMTRGMQGRHQVSSALDCLWPDTDRKPVFRRLVWELLALLAAFLALVITGAGSSHRSSGWLLPVCLLAPLTAIGLTAFRLRRPASGFAGSLTGATRQPVYAACMTLCLLLVAVVPALGLLTVCRTFEFRAHTAQWQQGLMSAIEARRVGIRSQLEGSRSLSPASKDFIRARLYQEGSETASPRNYIGAFGQTKMAPGREAAPPAEMTWWQTLLLAIRPELPEETIESGTLIRDRQRQGSCSSDLSAPGRQVLRCVGAPVEIDSALPETALARSPLWWVLILALVAAAFAWNCMAYRKLYALEFRRSPWPLLTEIDWRSKPAESQHLLVLGLPLTGKDRAVIKWLGFTPPRVNLCEARSSATWVEETVARLRSELHAQAVAAAQVTAGGGGMPSALAPHPPFVHISNLEAKLSEPGDRQTVMDLIGRLIVMQVGGVGVLLIVTSAVDPVFHFDRVLSEERKKTYEHPLPEPELQRLARLLHNFRKVGVPGPEPPPDSWPEVIRKECCQHKALLAVGKEVEPLARSLDDEGRLAMIAERARALYKLFWACCTRPEKLLLIQLAQTGFVNPGCFDTLEELIRKGLVRQDVRPRIMNETFRRFLATVEEPKTVREWESEGGEGSWAPIRNILLASVALCFVVIAMTQADTLQTASTAIAGILTAMAGVTRLLGYFTGGDNSPAPPAAPSS